MSMEIIYLSDINEKVKIGLETVDLKTKIGLPQKRDNGRKVD